MTRRKRTTLQRAAIFEAAGGVCHICEAKVGAHEAWELEHVIPFELTRDDSDDNLRPAHVKCHKSKTATDKRAIAKAKRVNAKFIGAHTPKNPMSGSRSGEFKRKIDGTTVRRDSE